MFYIQLTNVSEHVCDVSVYICAFPLRKNSRKNSFEIVRVFQTCSQQLPVAPSDMLPPRREKIIFYIPKQVPARAHMWASICVP